MTTFFVEADKNQDKFAEEGEFMDFANYIHSVGSWGCTIQKTHFDNVKTSTGGPNKFGQFIGNTECKKHKDENSCKGTCIWRGTPPACPTYEAPAIVHQTDACNKELPALISQQQLMVVTTAPKPLPPTNAMETEDASSRTINAER
jgi:hypothetical protein